MSKKQKQKERETKTEFVRNKKTESCLDSLKKYRQRKKKAERKTGYRLNKRIDRNIRKRKLN